MCKNFPKIIEWRVELIMGPECIKMKNAKSDFDPSLSRSPAQWGQCGSTLDIGRPATQVERRSGQPSESHGKRPRTCQAPVMGLLGPGWVTVPGMSPRPQDCVTIGPV